MATKEAATISKALGEESKKEQLGERHWFRDSDLAGEGTVPQMTSKFTEVLWAWDGKKEACICVPETLTTKLLIVMLEKFFVLIFGGKF